MCRSTTSSRSCGGTTKNSNTEEALRLEEWLRLEEALRLEELAPSWPQFR